jgi:hypothetical protein
MCFDVTIHHWRRTSKRLWRSRVSIPVPADCEPTALPSELHPLTADKKYVLQPMGFEPMPLSRLAPKASALTTRPKLHLLRNRDARKHKRTFLGNKKTVPGGTRTPNPQIRSLMRYPLRHWDKRILYCRRFVLLLAFCPQCIRVLKKRRQWDLNPRGRSPST